MIVAAASLTNGEKIYLDGMILSEAYWFNGMAWAMVAGATPALREDSHTFTVTHTEGGFQEFFRKAYKMQLPSDSSASIDDTVTAFS
jgi:hypothetical protein